MPRSRCSCSPSPWPSYGALLDDDAIVVIKGRVDMRDDRLKLVCMEVHRPELAADGATDLRIALPVNTLTDRTVEGLKRLFSEHPGDSPVFLHVGEKVLRLPPEFNVDSRRGLVGELRVLLGPNAIRLSWSRRCRSLQTGPDPPRSGRRTGRRPDTTGGFKSRKIVGRLLRGGPQIRPATRARRTTGNLRQTGAGG